MVPLQKSSQPDFENVFRQDDNRDFHLPFRITLFYTKKLYDCDQL